MGTFLGENLIGYNPYNSGAMQKVAFGGLTAGGFRGGQGKVGGGDNIFAQGISEVAEIGASKKAGFEVGLGGTNYATETTGKRLMLSA